jgi:hypothetical protein
MARDAARNAAVALFILLVAVRSPSTPRSHASSGATDNTANVYEPRAFGAAQSGGRQ